MSNEIQLTDTNFDQEVLKSPVPVMVDFWAPWCGPCKMIAPTIEEIATEYAGKVKVCKLNTDENPDTASKFNIMAIPTILVFKDGKVVQQLVGLHPKEAIQRLLDNVLS